MLKVFTFLLCLVPASALANVMTFKDLMTTFPQSTGEAGAYSEDGITTPNANFYLGESAHLDPPSDGHFPPMISFTMEKRFNAISFDINGTFLGRDPFKNVRVDGIRDGGIVVSNLFSTADISTYFFNSLFIALDEVKVSALDGFYENCPECGHFDIDNVELSPVPLPAALPLFGVALIGLGLMRKFKQKP
ncbi:MAG: VPLPA-CTERM sorting domain-containing protein [Proteobacteria bacterium]|nr:VPLPA-CTERM sorting domain-containing protein [Pseudomonadota bacterium]